MYKRIAGVLIAVIMLVSAVSAAVFSDMPSADYWSYEALSSAVEDGILTGSEGKIKPKNNLTRAEMATMLVRAYNLTDKADISEYTDVEEDAWYYEYMQKACAKGLFKGDDAKKLNPGNNITRQEVFVVLSRALNLTGGKVSVIDTFADKDDVASWAKGATAAMIDAGFIKGSGDKINPLSNITREEFAQIMYNLKKAGVLEEKNDEKAEDKKEEAKKEEDKKEEIPSGGDSSGGTSSRPSGGNESSKPSGGDKEEDKPVVKPSFEGIDENVDMSED